MATSVLPTLVHQHLIQQHPATTLFEGLALFLTVNWVAHLVYNLVFHPLASFPGPIADSASFLPQFLHRRAGDIRCIKELHGKYGEVVRIAPNELSFTGPQAWKDIYGFKPGQKQLPKQIVVDIPSIALKAPHLILAPDEAHTRMRRNLSHAFSANAVMEQEDLMTVHFDKMMRRIREEAVASSDRRVNMEKMFNCVAFDVIGDLAFGESFGALDSLEYHSYMSGVFKNLKIFSVFLRLSVYKWPLKAAFALMSVIPAAVEGRRRHFKFAAEQVEARITRETERKDFMSYILKNNEKDGRGLSREEMYSNSGLMIAAGSDTTSAALAGVTYYLTRHPEVLKKLSHEVRTAFTSSAEVSIASSQKLPYLHAVIEEGMRMYPPIPNASARVTNHATNIDGNMIPAGIKVAAQCYSVHRSENNFHAADTFIPERWLPDADPVFKNDRLDAVKPFSFGPRNCLGKPLAYAELHSILARIIADFDMELVSGSEGWLDQRVFLFLEKGPLWVRMMPRAS